MARTTTAEAVGDEIRRRRLESGKTLAELAEASEFDVSQLSKIERGQYGKVLAGYERIAAALGISLAALVRSSKKCQRGGRRAA